MVPQPVPSAGINSMNCKGSQNRNELFKCLFVAKLFLILKICAWSDDIITNYLICMSLGCTVTSKPILETQ